MKLWRKIRPVLGSVFTGILLLILCMNLYMILQKNVKGEINPTIFWYSGAVVLSGSMEPEIQVNDCVIVKKADEYRTGDIIMFQNEGNLVTHRIVKITEEGYITKGDANNTEDEGITGFEAVEGKVVMNIPKVGMILGFLQTPMGMCSLVLIALVILTADRLLIKNKKETVYNQKNP